MMQSERSTSGEVSSRALLRISSLGLPVTWCQPRSLIFRAVTGLVLIISLVTAVMLLSIDWFVSMQFTQLNERRILNQVTAIHQQLELERQGLAALNKLVSTESDLRSSTQYHLSLEGERRALEMDVERIASVFRFDLFGLWNSNGEVVLINEGGRADVVQGLGIADIQESRLIWHDDRLWVASSMPMVVNDVLLAWVGVVRQVNAIGPESGVIQEIRTSGIAYNGVPGARAALVDTSVISPMGVATSLELRLVDPVGDALDQTKRVVGITLLGAGVLLMLASVLYLRRVLNPVRELTNAVAQVPSRFEQGDLEPIHVKGGGEVAELGLAFNDMISNLRRLRALENELREQEKLSAIGRVAVRVAHDINNPLTVIRNTAHLLKSSPGSLDDRVRDLDMILHHCNRCASTVDNLLRFGRPLRLRYENVEINKFMEIFQESLHQRRPGVSVRYVPYPDALEIRGDRQQLEQMMDNLIDNALSANGGRDVLIESGAFENNMVFLRVTDYGKGFSEQELTHAFEFFYTRTPGGTGLGLPNARAIARAHGGDMEITDPAIGEITVRLSRKELPDKVV